jgi:hypothetical protein
MRAERTATMIQNYKQSFTHRGGTTPSDPLEFHFYHLARYWSRLVGFCRQDTQKPEQSIDGDLGACVQVGSLFINELIDIDSPIYDPWQDYWKKWQSILRERPVSIAEIESASDLFNACTAALKYDPWAKRFLG